MAELNLLRGENFTIDGKEIKMPQNREFWQEAQKVAEEKGISKDLINRNSSQVTRAYLDDMGITRERFGKMLNPELRRANVGMILENDNTKPLFETLVESFVRGAYERAGRAAQLTMGQVAINQQTTSFYYTEGYNDEDFDFLTIAQGGPIPVATIQLAPNRSIQVYKRGLGLELTDEAKAMTFNMVNAFAQRQGVVLGRTDENLVIKRLLEGYFDDGFDKPATLGVKTQGKISPMDLWYAQNYMVEETGFTPKVAVMNLKTAEDWTSMETTQGAPIFLQNQLDGTTPNLLRAQPFVTNQMEDGKIMLVDTQFAINEYVFKALSTESDRNIKTQVDGTYSTKTSDFVPFETKARLIIDVNETRGK